ncbi:uncharacterized protein BDR25DRAFT_353607 [Lindgomyces ingoldianus]|uniref:Uncharacterized protein n=1 Tax=Lindgomyces ingoldianus TaxID=673940 RepID=A0ACB6QZV2_9PLEO|nr:uncharacterized protein BDR25DRAFT_353607 [Lindgomyces ingoldianus]KAF2472569.1 hypothetical protein BDR25DRAFT_353607 [Lindgomyces ingoldianus]
MEDQWNPYLQTPKGHSGWVRSAAFSRDLSRLASKTRVAASASRRCIGIGTTDISALSGLIKSRNIAEPCNLEEPSVATLGAFSVMLSGVMEHNRYRCWNWKGTIHTEIIYSRVFCIISISLRGLRINIKEQDGMLHK